MKRVMHWNSDCYCHDSREAHAAAVAVPEDAVVLAVRELPRCGYRLAGEPEPCGMAIEYAGDRWRHTGWPALDRVHDAVRI